MSNLAYLHNLNEELNDQTLREMVFKRLMKEYGRVIERELKKNQETLTRKMAITKKVGKKLIFTWCPL